MKRTRHIWWGGLLIVLGVMFLLDSLQVLDFKEFFRTYWPLLLVLWGIMILRRRSRAPEMRMHRGHGKTSEVFGNMEGNLPAEGLHWSNVLGDVNVHVTSPAFRGGFVSTVFGDVKLDLTGAALAEGEQHLKVTGVFGDTTIELPKDLPCSVSANTMAGRIQVNEQVKDGFSSSLIYASPGYAAATKKINIVLSRVFGDVTVRS
jgi:lia operon protein LiaF